MRILDNYNRSVINEEKDKVVAPKLPRQNHESKKSEQSSSNSLDRSKSHKSKITSSSSSSKHHSSSSKYLTSGYNRSSSSTKSSEHQDKNHKNKSDNKSSDKHHLSSHETSHKRSREEVDSKDTEPKSKKIKSDDKADKQSSSRSSSSKSSHKSDNHKSSSSSSSRHSKSKPAQIHISTPDLLTQKPKLDLSPDLVNDLNVSAFDFLPPFSKSSNNRPSKQAQPKQGPTESELLTKSISSIKSRTRIFSGNTRGGSVIPKLNDMCLRVLTLNLDYVGCIGDIPFDILRPALEKAKPEQLTKIEYYNPYLLEDSDVLWKAICQRKWRNRQPVEMESWREMYERCNREDEEKLNRLTKNIRQTQQQTSNCVQRTKIAFVDTVVKAPRGIVRKPVETFSSTRKPVMSLTARIEALKSSKPNFVAPKNVQSKIAASFRESLQPINKRGTVQRTTSTKPAPMMAKLLSKFRR